LAQYGLGRSGTIYVIAAGRCWHNAPSTSPLHDNSPSIGIEAELCREFDLPSEPWTACGARAAGRPPSPKRGPE
jgi:hypothetical protein